MRNTKCSITLAVCLCFLICNPCFAQDIETGLVHHWKCDESGQSEVAFDSVGTNHLSLGGYGPNDPRWVPGVMGNALSFSKTENWALSQTGIPLDTFTFAVWLKRLDDTGLEPRIATPLGEAWITINDFDHEGVGMGDVHCLIPPILNVWEHYVLTVDIPNDQLVIYKNGFFSRSGDVFFSAPDPDPWRFAHNQGAGNQAGSFNGLFDDIRIYDRILTADDAFALFSLGNNSANADDFNVIRGFHVGGELPDTFSSDDSYLLFRPGFVLVATEPPVWLSFEGTLATDNPTALSFMLEAKGNTINLVQTIEMFDYDVGAYELVDTQQANIVDTIVVYEVDGDLSRFVEPGTGNVQARLGWKANGLILLFPWTVSIDQVVWAISQD